MQEQKDRRFVQSFVALTTSPNALMASIHNRMPVVLEESQFDEWLDTKTAESALRSMLRPAPNDWLVANSASALVNSVKNDSPELLAGLFD